MRTSKALILSALTTWLGLFSPRSLESQDLARRIDRYLQQRADSPFNGVILIAHNGEPVFERAYGMADADLAVPNQLDTRFAIGSLTKPLTATAIMQLVERGRLQLTDSICAFLAQCPEAWRAVTIRHLLSHTSGIADLFAELPPAPVDSTDVIISTAIVHHLRDTLVTVPGTVYAYSNFNYFLLGYVIEHVSHVPWERALQQSIFAPATMTATRYNDVWAIVPGRARGYTRENGTLRNIVYHDPAAYAAGGLVSTAHDLLRFDVALSAHRLVADSTLHLMTTPGLGNYGLGWQALTVFGRHMRNHTGGVDGFASHLAHYDDGTTVIVLSNVETEAAKATACDIAAITFGLEPSSRETGQSACRATP